MKISKKILAKEWLIFITFFLFGLFIMPLIDGLFSFYPLLDYTYHDIELEDWEFIAFIRALAPYLMIQIARFTYWSFKVLNK